MPELDAKHIAELTAAIVLATAVVEAVRWLHRRHRNNGA